jgi:hypothetical protein
VAVLLHRPNPGGQGGRRRYPCAGHVEMAEIVKLAELQPSRNKARKRKTKTRLTRAELGKGHTRPFFRTGTLSTPLATELMQSRETALPMLQGQSTILESGVLAFRRESDGEPLRPLDQQETVEEMGHPERQDFAKPQFPRERRKGGVRGGGRNRLRLAVFGWRVSREEANSKFSTGSDNRGVGVSA